MKFSFGILALLLVSAFAVELKPNPIDYEQYRTYVYEYVGNVLTGIPFSSSLYSGTQLKANVGISHLQHNRNNLYTLKLQNVTFSSLIGEVTEPVKANFNRPEKLEQKAKDVLELTFQYAIDNVTQRLQWIEVDQADEPWSLNIKKAIIEMFLVDIAGKQLKLNPEYELSLTRSSNDEVHHSFDVYEPTSKGECETMYQVVNALPESVQGPKGIEKFFWKVMKTRNYQNCTSSPKLTQHNWERKGCAEYCKQALIMGETQMHNHYSAERSQCNCDEIETEPLDQQSTTTYYIECRESPYILYAENNGKVVFDNHGTKFVSFTNQTLTFQRVHGGYYDPLNSKLAVRVSNLTFSLYPYTGSVAQVLTHEIPAFNLLVPRGSQSSLYDATVELLTQVAEVVVGKSEEQQNIAGFMTRIIQNLAHLDSQNIMRIYREYAMVPVEKLYSNTVESVRRQLFLDAITHVGTTNVSLWLEQVLQSDSESEGLYPMELRQVIETLPLNVYAPTKSLINLLEKKMNALVESEEWDQLSVYVVAYGKLIAKACPNTGVVSESDNEIQFIPIRTRSNDWLIPEDEKCTREQTVEYIEDLVKMLEKTKVIRGKLLIAQALAHTGKTLALEALAPYAKDEFNCPTDDVSDCVFFRTSVIYSLHHLTAVEPKRVRSIVLPIFNRKIESYELRLAAFTVLMSAGPKRYELDSVRVSLRNETSLQVISMVRSILEETANLTQACNQPLAQAAREIVATLPKVNIDGLYSQASYNEWYSTDKSTGFFANGQFVANNITAVPRAGYLNIGSHWKSLSNPWFTVAFQQKGLETAFYKLFQKAHATSIRDPATIEQLWEDLQVVSRNEDNFMLKLFVRVYEQTSLFTLDKYSLNVLYNQAMDLYDRFNAAASQNEVDFNWVRFYMPSTYTDVVPSAIGLPVIATKQNRQIVSLRLDRAEFEESRDEGVQSYTFKVTPQVYTSSYLALSVFNQGIKTPFNYGVYTLKNFTFYAPLHLNFKWNEAEKLYTYAVKPVFNRVNFIQSNNNYAFIAESYIGTVVKAITQDITSLVPTYHHPLMQFKSRALGMNLNLGLSTERPWFLDLTSIPCDGAVAWLLEKYNEMNQFNSNMNLTLVQNEDFPAIGFAGSFDYSEYLGGKYETLEGSMKPQAVLSEALRNGHSLRKLYPSKFRDAAYYSRSMRVVFSTFGQEVPTSFSTILTMVNSIDHHAYWYRVNSSIESINEQIWAKLPRQFVVDGKLERPTIPSDLKWFLRNPEKIVGNFIAKISWNDEITSEHDDYKILINGDLRRSVRDPVIPEMERQSWFHKQCEKDIKNGNAANYACELLAAHQAYFNRVGGAIEFKNVEEPVRKSLRIVYSELKRSLINYWKPWSTVSTKDVESIPDIVTFEALYSNIIYKRPVITLIVQTPTELVNFTRFIVPVETFPTLIPMGYLKASPLPKDQTCVVMKDSIRTFDNVTYRTWIDECEFVVAMDCNGESKQFAVTVKGKAGKRSVRVYTPLKTYLKIRDVKKDQASLTIHGANDEQIGEDFIVKTGTPVLHISENGIQDVHQVFMHDGTVNVILPSEKVRVAFDGFYLKVTTSPLYIGKTCGLCGNQNQEFTYEFVGPELNDLESDLTTFRDSYALHNCTDPNPCHDDVCDEETPVHYGRRNSIAAPKKNTKAAIRVEYKTLVERRGERDCFSKFPQIVCKEGHKAVNTESRSIQWVCFAQTHPLHKQWIELAKKRVLEELAEMPTTEIAAYEEPSECASIRGI